jgi:hypothetical protein
MSRIIIFASLAEFERNVNLERTKAGLSAAIFEPKPYINISILPNLLTEPHNLFVAFSNFLQLSLVSPLKLCYSQLKLINKKRLLWVLKQKQTNILKRVI